MHLFSQTYLLIVWKPNLQNQSYNWQTTTESGNSTYDFQGVNTYTS